MAEQEVNPTPQKFAVVQEYELATMVSLPAALDHIFETVEDGTLVKISMGANLANEILQTQVTYMERLLELERALLHAGIKAPAWDINAAASPTAVVAADMYIGQALIGEGSIKPRASEATDEQP